MNIFYQTLSDFPLINFTETKYIMKPAYFLLNFQVNAVLWLKFWATKSIELIYEKLIVENPISEPISSFGL